MYLSIYLPIHPSIHWPNYPSTHLSIHIWIHSPMYQLIKLTILYLAYFSVHLSTCTNAFSYPSIGSSFIYLSTKSISTQLRIRDSSCFSWLYPKLPTCWFIWTVYVCPERHPKLINYMDHCEWSYARFGMRASSWLSTVDYWDSWLKRCSELGNKAPRFQEILVVWVLKLLYNNKLPPPLLRLYVHKTMCTCRCLLLNNIDMFRRDLLKLWRLKKKSAASSSARHMGQVVEKTSMDDWTYSKNTSFGVLHSLSGAGSYGRWLAETYAEGCFCGGSWCLQGQGWHQAFTTYPSPTEVYQKGGKGLGVRVCPQSSWYPNGP